MKEMFQMTMEMFIEPTLRDLVKNSETFIEKEKANSDAIDRAGAAIKELQIQFRALYADQNLMALAQPAPNDTDESDDSVFGSDEEAKPAPKVFVTDEVVVPSCVSRGSASERDLYPVIESEEVESCGESEKSTDNSFEHVDKVVNSPPQAHEPADEHD